MLLVTKVAGFRTGFLTAMLAAGIWLAVDLNVGIKAVHQALIHPIPIRCSSGLNLSHL